VTAYLEIVDSRYFSELVLNITPQQVFRGTTFHAKEMVVMTPVA
jgi:hypothetical protein